MGVIYLLKSEGTNQYKIGITRTTIEKRLKSIQTGNANKVIIRNHFESEYYTRIERTLHRQLKEYHSHGEWFELPPEEVNMFITYCQTIHDNLTFLNNSKNPFI